MSNRILVLGAGSWGTALAILLANNGHQVCLWSNVEEHILELSNQRTNARYLPGISFPEKLSASSNLEEAIANASHVLMVIPSHGFREVLQKVKPFWNKDKNLIWASKGLDPKDDCLLHEVVAEELGASFPSAVISGPSFAKEVAQGLPTVVTVGSTCDDFAQEVSDLFSNPRFRIYTTNDVTGLEIGGAAKNVVAIAVGISDGMKFGANARAALITRGIAEISRIGMALGAQPETLTGLSGLGDLVLTCTDNQSRNRRFGLLIGNKHKIDHAVEQVGQVVEGYQNSKQLWRLSQRLKISAPIIEQVYRILHEGLDPDVAVERLFSRTQGAEKI